MEVHCVRVSTKRQLDQALEIRWRVFGEEMRLISGTAMREHDEWDTRETTMHWIAYVEGLPAGTIRLQLPNREIARANQLRLGLPMELLFNLGLETESTVASFAQAERVCVLPEYRRSRALACLISTMFHESVRLGVTHWLGAVSCETDHPEDADIVHRLVKARGLVSERWRAEPRAAAGGGRGSQRPLYRRTERLQAQRGELGCLRLPRVLAFNARKLRALTIGQPSFDWRFGVFSLPVVSELCEIPPATLQHQHDDDGPELRDRLAPLAVGVS